MKYKAKITEPQLDHEAGLRMVNQPFIKSQVDR